MTHFRSALFIGTFMAEIAWTVLPGFAQDVVVNGGFETNTPSLQAPPWVFTGVAGAGAFGFANSGNAEALLADNAGSGGAGQTLTLRRGGLYQLTYYALDISTAGLTSYTLTSSLNGKPILTTMLSGTNITTSYQKLTANVTVARGTPLLSFQAIANTAGPETSFLFLDDVSLVLLSSAINFRKAAVTQNQHNAADALYAATKQTNGQTGPTYTALTNVSGRAAPAVLDSLSGEGITATQNLANRSAQLFNDSIFDQTTFYGSGSAGNQITLTDTPPAFTAYAPLSGDRTPIHELADLPSASHQPVMPALPNRTWRAWASGFGGVEDIHGNAVIGSAAQDNTIYGGTLGVDYQLTPNYLVGIALGGSDGAFQVPGRTTSGSTTGGHVAFYDLATFGAFYGASSNSFSYFTNRTTRFVGGFGGLASETERGDFDSHEFRSRLEFGRHMDGVPGFGTVTPFIALEIAELRSNGFGETSVTGPGLFRLNVSGQSAADVPGFIGLRFQSVMPLGGMAFVPSLQVAWEHEFAPYRSQIGAIADLPGSTFLIDGAQPARDAAQVKAGGEVRIGTNSALFANFDGEFSGVNQLYTGKGGLRWMW